jgi:hypothetical protein
MLTDFLFGIITGSYKKPGKCLVCSQPPDKIIGNRSNSIIAAQSFVKCFLRIQLIAYNQQYKYT